VVARLVRGPKKTKAQKDHTCRGCGEKISKNENYFVTTCVFDGRIYDIKECGVCREYFQDYCSTCDDYEVCIGEHYFVGIIKECRKRR